MEVLLFLLILSWLLYATWRLDVIDKSKPWENNKEDE